ncbi:hypothetical protein IHN63_02210 [Deinococcus sp. 6YEL10]|uniref:hypothetical protein n=1 Tax=Deinococcus sp. 6YEL10 TaxID=2745870 RepID=UPI001E6039F5|nr:hypothetical protein [Deinococcus sp. 6YEL10]MCD0160114.1 hypothetical protein [Deinococcus sp. 6YEL10]
MSGFFDGVQLNVPCPNCGHEVPQTLGWLKRSPEWVCVGCGRTVQLDAEQVARSVKEMEDAVADLQREFKKLGQ